MSNKFLIKNPLLTEKATEMTAWNKYSFAVKKEANASEIKKAIKQIYKVDAVKVNIVNVKPKKRRLGRTVGTKPGYKKAIVTVKDGQKIDIVGA